MIVPDPDSFFSSQSINPDECLTDIEITEPIIIDSINELSLIKLIICGEIMTDDYKYSGPM